MNIRHVLRKRHVHAPVGLTPRSRRDFDSEPFPDDEEDPMLALPAADDQQGQSRY